MVTSFPIRAKGFNPQQTRICRLGPCRGTVAREGSPKIWGWIPQQRRPHHDVQKRGDSCVSGTTREGPAASSREVCHDVSTEPNPSASRWGKSWVQDAKPPLRAPGTFCSGIWGQGQRTFFWASGFLPEPPPIVSFPRGCHHGRVEKIRAQAIGPASHHGTPPWASHMAGWPPKGRSFTQTVTCVSKEHPPRSSVAAG
ncbi:hypothetical protein GWK47_054898 [Chionoecetes opilio]|uniref:Uncharacterized protein n=1 Tax=Chionoecetes opilio TaxID=41210 RepID=A0A8J4Y4L9_CHIOP|nr:hypothetical protein GWK47_054898 [Chionoecetes opilio]